MENLSWIKTQIILKNLFPLTAFSMVTILGFAPVSQLYLYRKIAKIKDLRF